MTMAYSVPPLAELLSPAELESLANGCQSDEDIYALLEAWGVPARREEMQEWALDFIAKQIAFQIQDENVVRLVVYGPPGKGKSELAQSLAFFIIDVYQEHNANILGWPKIARSPSDANDVLGEETKKGNTICLILDEKERESGLASITELNALVQNIDTMRILRHSLLLIAITKQELGKLVSRCQIVFRAIFKDKINRINWCIMYVNDMEANTLLPLAIVGIPLHPHQWFRDWYEKEKRKNQVDLTVAGGRSKADPKKIKNAATDVLAFLKENKIVNPKRGTIKEILTTEIPNVLIGDEMNLTASRVLRLLKAEKSETPPLKKSPGVFSKDWLGLRQFIEQWCLKHDPPHEEYATATALWIVPDEPPLSQDDMGDIIDIAAIPCKLGTLTRNIRILRKRIQRPDLEFTDFTEAWVASQLASLSPRHAGGKNAVDIVLEGGKEVAVKFCVRNDPFYDYTVAPETDGVVVIVIPRRLQFFVIPIGGNVVNEHLQLDSARVQAGGVLVGIENLVGTVREMLND
jgi:hypothetical protein